MKSPTSMQVIGKYSKGVLIIKLTLSLILSHIVFIPSLASAQAFPPPMPSMMGQEGSLFKVNRNNNIYFGSDELSYSALTEGERSRLYYLARTSQDPQINEVADQLMKSENEYTSNESECSRISKWIWSSCDEETRKATLARATREREANFDSLVGKVKSHYQNNPERAQELAAYDEFRFIGTDPTEAKNEEVELPSYCQNYPTVGTESYEAYMGQADKDEVIYMTCRENEPFNLKVGDLVNNYLQVEAFQYEKGVEALQKELARASIDKLLDAREEYRNFDSQMENPKANELTQCLNEKLDKQNPKDVALMNKYLDGESKSPITTKAGRGYIQTGNRVPAANEKTRKDQFLALNLKNALITKAIFDEIDQARNIHQSASNAAELKFSECAYSVPQIPGRKTEAARLVQERCNPKGHQAKMEELGKTLKEKVDAGFGQLHGLVRDNPLIFDEVNKSSLTDWFNYELAPSEMASELTQVGKAPELVQGIKEAMASNPEDPFKAANEFLASQKDSFADIVKSAKDIPSIKTKFDKGIADQFKGLTESALYICNTQGDRLHHFPDLMTKVLEDAAQEGSGTEARAKLMQYQGAYCYLLRNDPPKNSEGFTLMQGIGIGMAVIGTVAQIVPVLGTAVGTALIVGGGALTATDAAIKVNAQQGRRNNAKAMHVGGWADYQKVLTAESAVADAWSDVALEALFFTGDAAAAAKLASHASRTARVAGGATDTATAVRVADDLPRRVISGPGRSPTGAITKTSDEALDVVRPVAATRVDEVSEAVAETMTPVRASIDEAPVTRVVPAEELRPVRVTETAPVVREADEVSEVVTETVTPVRTTVEEASAARVAPVEEITPVRVTETAPVVREADEVSEVVTEVIPPTREAERIRPVELTQELTPVRTSEQATAVKEVDEIPAVVARPSDEATIVKPTEVGPVQAEVIEAKPVETLSLTARSADEIEEVTPVITSSGPRTRGGARRVAPRSEEIKTVVARPIDTQAAVRAELARRPAAITNLELVAKLSPQNPSMYDDFVAGLSKAPESVQKSLLEHIEKGHFSPEELSKLMDESAQVFRRSCR